MVHKTWESYSTSNLRVLYVGVGAMQTSMSIMYLCTVLLSKYFSMHYY